ncbi:MAG TPA: HAD-IC family P-type ATPase [Candidatus Saccharimonadales bacterium]|nr:HAD-IC family P-type ATPase [Candidatus Saccharimonadales bacterium]
MNRSLATKINFTILITIVISLAGYFLKIFMNFETPLLIAVGLIATVPVVISAVSALKNKKVTVDLLASIALAVALINREWASVAFINLMITSARIFGDYTEGKADDAIKSLLKLRPEKVKIKTKDGTNIVGIENVKIGDLVIVEAGDRVPVDGVIEEGEASIDQSSLTGESIPVTKIKGQKALSSTLNLSGSFIMKTEKVGKDTTFEKIIALIQEAQDSKQGIQGIADRFATIYITVTLFGSLALYLLTHDTNLILAVLLVACADDIAIAIPMAFWGAIAKAGKHGIIIKGGEFLEGLSNLESVIMDKTGTITKGIIKTEKIISLNGFKSPELLRIVGNVESVSEHPIAKAIVAHAVSDGIKIKTPEKFHEVAGKGIIPNENKKNVLTGHLQLLTHQGVEIH